MRKYIWLTRTFHPIYGIVDGSKWGKGVATLPVKESMIDLRPDNFRTSLYALEVLASAGFDINRLLAGGPFTSLADFARNGLTLPDEALQQLAYSALNELSRIVRERDGGPLPRSVDWHLLVFCLLSCHSLRDAILRMNEFFVAIDGRCGYTSLHLDQSGHAELRFQCLHTIHDRLTLLLDAFGMANIFGLLRWLIADPIPVSKVVLPHARPSENEWIEFFLPFPFDPHGEENAICFPARFLDHPVMRTSADYETHAADFTADSRDGSAPVGLVDQARTLMYETLRRDVKVISLDTLAERLGRNRETLRRQLKVAGSSYREIKDSCRRQLALNLLRRTDMRIEEVAIRLDYCDSDALRRSVHEWVGMSPSEYRRLGSLL